MPVQKSTHSDKSISKQTTKSRKYKPSKVEKYIAGLQTGKNKKEAALEAGYSESTARNPKHIIEGGIAYKTAQEKFKDYLGEDKIWGLIAERLLDCLKKNETQFYKDKEGNPREFIGSKPDSRAVNRAVMHIAKLTGFYNEEQREVLVSKNDLSHLSTEQLKQMIADNARRLQELKAKNSTSNCT